MSPFTGVHLISGIPHYTGLHNKIEYHWYHPYINSLILDDSLANWLWPLLSPSSIYYHYLAHAIAKRGDYVFVVRKCAQDFGLNDLIMVRHSKCYTFRDKKDFFPFNFKEFMKEWYTLRARSQNSGRVRRFETTRARRTADVQILYARTAWRVLLLLK